MNVAVRNINNKHAVQRLAFGPVTVTKPEPKRNPLVLTPIQWGKRDALLGRVVCQNIADTMPSIVVPFNLLSYSRVRSFLRHRGIGYY